MPHFASLIWEIRLGELGVGRVYLGACIAHFDWIARFLSCACDIYENKHNTDAEGYVKENSK